MRLTAKKIVAQIAPYFRLRNLQPKEGCAPDSHGSNAAMLQLIAEERSEREPKDWLNTHHPHKPNPAPPQKKHNVSELIPNPYIASSLSEQTEPDSKLTPYPQTSLNILVAEDNYANQLVAKTLLMRAGHRVSTVTNGYDAVNACLNHCFDIILMDIEMPRMTGVEATQIIRSTSGPNQNTRIIALTAYGSARNKFSYLNSGLDDVLCKPFKLTELRTCLAHQPLASRGAPTDMIDTNAPHRPVLEMRKKPSSERVAANDPDMGSLINESTIETLLDNAELSQIHALVKVFWQSAYALLDDMQYAAHHNDPKSLARAAHALKGSAINLGLLQLSENAAHMKDTSPNDALIYLESLEHCMTRTRKALGVFIGGYAA